MHKKSLLLVKEVISSLNEENAAKIENGILRLEGITYIAVTHKTSAERLVRCNQILCAENGMLYPQEKIEIG